MMWKNPFLKALSLVLIIFLFHGAFHSVRSAALDHSYESLSQKLTKILPPGWKLAEAIKHFTPENLYEHIDGRAEFFFAYGMVQMTFAAYTDPTETATFIDVCVYDMGHPSNAFGVFAAERPEVFHPIDVNRAGYLSGGNLFIWKGSYYVRMIASDDSSRLQRINMELAKELSDSLYDSGESLWGLEVLPTIDRVPGSERYFRQDAMGLDFMANTYMAQYRKNGVIVTVFLSKKDHYASARKVLRRYVLYVEQLGEGLKEVTRNGVVISLCDMGGTYDAIFQREDVVAGVTSVKDPVLAVDSAFEIWQHLNTY
ncbi:MAG: hypothetical protein JSW12_08350 [Deltaproteobacteria bacterium]|nr:MAG: hypothetical protein JSW12_08350 [Deltaproteobacteria bacterium]